MALALKRVRGQDVTVVTTGGGTNTAWESIDITETISSSDASAAAATFDQKTLKRKSCSGTITGFLGTEGVLPTIGATITALSISVSSDEVGPTDVDVTATYGLLKVMSTNYNFTADPAKYSFTFESGFIV